MKVLVTAASRHGATAEIAAAIGEALTARGLQASVVDPGAVTNLEGYDAVVLGFVEKAMVKAFKAEEGDFRDWKDIEAWASEIAGSLQGGPGRR